MFKKPPSVKNLSVLRSSDRKKIVQQIILSYLLQDADSVEIRNALLPDGAQSAKFITHLDEPGVLYYDTQGMEPLWIKVMPPGRRDEVLIPTVYSMWRHPTLLKTVNTWHHVLTKLQGGADLMTPGLTGWNTSITAGDVVAVTLQDKVPLAVGVAGFDIGRLSKAVGEKGKAVYLVHCYNDDLWSLGSKTRPPTSITPVADLHVEESMQQLSLDADGEDNANIETMQEPTDETNNSEKEPAVIEPSISEIDNAFKSAAIYGLYQIKIAEAQNSISLPLPSSTLVSTHLNPYLSAEYAQITFKKTSWKKAATFLKKFLEIEGVVKTKDRGGETVIMSINWNHKLIAEFQPYRLSPKEVSKPGPAENESSSGSTNQMLQIRELYKPAGKALKSILEAQSKSKDDLYNASQIREILAILGNYPIGALTRRFIKIDYNLAPLLKPAEANVVSLPRDKLLDRLLESSASYYSISLGNETQTRKGKPPKIHIILEKRQGRKTVTRFSGLEAFFIDPNELAEELRNSCATSASVGALHSASPKQPVMEVLIQGPQASAVIAALEKRGVKKTFIVLEDKRK